MTKERYKVELMSELATYDVVMLKRFARVNNIQIHSDKPLMIKYTIVGEMANRKFSNG